MAARTVGEVQSPAVLAVLRSNGLGQKKNPAHKKHPSCNSHLNIPTCRPRYLPRTTKHFCISVLMNAPGSCLLRAVPQSHGSAVSSPSNRHKPVVRGLPCVCLFYGKAATGTVANNAAFATTGSRLSLHMGHRRFLVVATRAGSGNRGNGHSTSVCLRN